MKDKKSIRELYLAIENEFNDELVLMDTYKEIINRRINKAEFLEKELTKNNFDQFREYVDIESEMQGFQMEEAFVKGFSIAYQLFVESFQ